MAGNANSGRRPRAEEELMVGGKNSPAVPDISITAEIQVYQMPCYIKLSDSARAILRRALRNLMKLGLITPLDVELLCRWAYWVDKSEYYSAQLDQTPLDGDTMGAVVVADKMVDKFGAKLGLSIYDRQRLRMKAAPSRAGIVNNGIMNLISQGRTEKKEAPDEQ